MVAARPQHVGCTAPWFHGGGSLECLYRDIWSQANVRKGAYVAEWFGTLSHQGPMTRTVSDAALMLTVMAQTDSRDWYALPASETNWSSYATKSVKGWKIAFSPDLGHARVDPEIATLVKAAAKTFASLGAHVEG